MPRSASAGPVAGSYPLTYATAELAKDLDVDGGWLLSIDGVPSSYLDVHDPTHLEFEYIRWIADVLECWAEPPAPLAVAHLGGAGCTLPRYVEAIRPAATQIVFEYDVKMVELVRDAFGVRTSKRLRMRAIDARDGLAGLRPASYDAVVRDAFAGAVVPDHLMTLEFLREVSRVVGPTGVYAANIADRPPLALARSEVATAMAVFPHVTLVAEPALLRGRRHGNLVLAASHQPIPGDALAQRVSRGAIPARVLSRRKLETFCAGSQVMTDALLAELAAAETAARAADPKTRRTLTEGVSF